MKDTFFKSTLILLIGGALTKMLGMIIKIIMTRTVGVDSVSLYMLVFPTFSLFMTIAQLGFPTAISKIIAEDTHNNKKVILSIIPISIMFNSLLIILIYFISPYISSLLNDNRTYLPILSIALVLPFDSLSSILRGYFFGKQNMLPHILSLLTEQIVRLLLIIFFIPSIMYKGIVITVSFLILINVISEFLSTIVLLLFIKNKIINKHDLKPDKKEISNVFSIAIPTTLSRLVGSISYFFEPIIITTLLLSKYDLNYIVSEYGIIEGYVLPLLLLPSFLSGAISGSLIPDISKKYAKKDILGIKRRIKQVIKISLFLGVSISLILFINPKIFLNLIFRIDKGTTYIKVLSPFFIVLYLQYPLESVLQALNKSKDIMKNNIIGVSLKLFTIFVFSFLNIGLYNLIIAIIVNILITTYLHYKKIKETLY